MKTKKTSLTCLGLMSGMSMDSIDVVLMSMTTDTKSPEIRYIDATEVRYTKLFKQKLLDRIYNASSVSDLSELNVEIGKKFADAANKLISNHSNRRIDVIGSHGQTVDYHMLKKKVGVVRAATMQLGDASIIARETGITTVSDFRQNDIAASGLGAPLAPIFHYRYLSQLKQSAVVINIGSIANATFIPGVNASLVMASDIGPGNMAIDEIMRRCFNREYDPNGRHAAKGSEVSAIVKEMTSHPIVKKQMPKALGYEFGVDWVSSILKRYKRYSPEDIVCSVTNGVAACMAHAVRKWAREVDTIVFCGGGAKNTYLISKFKDYYPSHKVINFDDLGLSGDVIEAMLCAYMAGQTIQGKPSSLPHTTGALNASVLGKITPGQNYNRLLGRLL